MDQCIDQSLVNKIMVVGKFKYIAVLGVWLTIAAYSCQTNSSKEESKHQTSQDTLTYKVVDFFQNSPYFLKGEQGMDTTYFFASYPYFENEKINQLLRSSILIDGEDSVQQAAESFLSGFNEFVEDSADPSYHTAWFREVRANVLINRPNVLSIATDIDDFSGGAHGNHVKLIANFDLKNDKKIALDDLVSKEKRKEFLKIAEKFFRKTERLSDQEQLEGKYFFENGQYSLAENFGLERENLLFYYNPYEIKSYAEGTTALRIPYQAIEHLLTDSGKTYVQSIIGNQPKT
jgi:hypothetical protein